MSDKETTQYTIIPSKMNPLRIKTAFCGLHGCTVTKTTENQDCKCLGCHGQFCQSCKVYHEYATTLETLSEQQLKCRECKAR